MNYRVIRYIIIILIILSFILYVYFYNLIIKNTNKIIKDLNDNGKDIIVKKENNKKIKVWKIFIFLLFIWIILNIIPFENYFIKFDTIEKNINYYFTNPKIKKKFIYNDYAFVKIENKTISNLEDYFIYLTKKNKSWEFSNLLTKNQCKSNSVFDTYSYCVIEIPNKNAYAIEVSSPNKIDVNVSDSLNSKVITNSSSDWYYYYIIINQKVDKNKYKLYINDEKYKPLDTKNKK